MSKTGIVAFAVHSFILAGAPCTMLIFGSKACKIRLLSSPGLPELTEDEIALARQQDRLDYAATKARGVWRNAGPPACPLSGGWTRPKQ